MHEEYSGDLDSFERLASQNRSMAAVVHPNKSMDPAGVKAS